MGLFPIKKDNKLDELKKKLVSLFNSSEIEEFTNFWEKNVENSSKIPFGNFELLEDVTKIIAHNDASSSYNTSQMFKLASELYSKLVFDENDKVQIKIFTACLDYCLMGLVNVDDVVAINGLFQDKSVSLTFFNCLDENNMDSDDIANLKKYMLQARQYYVDDNAFLAACMTVMQKRYNFDNFIEEKIAEDKQLAGIYDISEEKISELYDKFNEANSSVFNILRDIRGFSSDLKRLRNSLSDIKGLSEAKQKELLDEISKYDEMFENSKTTIFGEISEVGEKYINIIQQKLDANPGVKKQISSGKTAPIIKYFDTKIPLVDRFEEAKGNKKGKLYHYCFDDALKQMLINKSVYLVGPGGTGKTTIVAQLAELLGLKLYNVGFVADEFTSIKGYMDATGNFVKTPFYTAFKEGGLFFLDEIDNSESKALIELNKFVSNEGYKPYLFPNDELVTPHPNFRLVAAGNTWGDGADIAYSTRENLDASTLRRFPQIYCGFDEDLERAMFDCRDKDMFAFCMAFRSALTEREGTDEFSTGDLSDINSYLKSGLFSTEEIMQLKFIKNRRNETLQNILSSMRNSLGYNKYLESFETEINKGPVYVKGNNRARR